MDHNIQAFPVQTTLLLLVEFGEELLEFGGQESVGKNVVTHIDSFFLFEMKG